MVKFSVDTTKLKIYMVKRNLDRISKLSDASGIDRNTLSKVINGKIKPSPIVMEKLVNTLEIDPTDAGPIFFVSELTKSVRTE